MNKRAQKQKRVGREWAERNRGTNKLHFFAEILRKRKKKKGKKKKIGKRKRRRTKIGTIFGIAYFHCVLCRQSNYVIPAGCNKKIHVGKENDRNQKYFMGENTGRE